MKAILFFVVFLGGILYASPHNDNDKEFKEVRDKIKKEVRENVIKLIGELNAALDKHIAIADDKSKSRDEKINALLELRQENPKVYNVLWSMFERFIPPRLFYKRHENLNETEKAEIDKAKQEVRAKIRKVAGELRAVFDKGVAIVDDKSKTPKEKNKALWELRKENPVANDVLDVILEQFFSKRKFFDKFAFVLSKQLNDTEKAKWGKMAKEIEEEVTKLLGKLNAAMDKLTAIADDKSKTFREKARAFRELRDQNPKVYNVLQAIYEQFTPKFRHLGKVYRKLNDTEKEKVSEGLKKVRASVTKLIGEMRAVFDKGTAILNDKSKTSEEKMNALWELSKENPKANDILNIAVDQFIPWKLFRRRRMLRRMFGRLNETEKAELKKAMQEIKKEVREKATKLIGELNEAMEKQIAIIDDQSKSFAEKHKALWELRKQNPKANNVLWAIFEQFVPVPRHFHHIKKSLNETEKAKWAEIKKEARANATKLIGELNTMLDKKTAILDDTSKTPKEKFKALCALRKENPKVYNVLRTVFAQFIPKRELPRRGRRLQRRLFPRRRFDKKYENLTETEKEARRDKKRREVRANVAKIIGGLNDALDKQSAIFDDKSKTIEEKMKAFSKLRRENPKAYRVLRFMFRQFAPRRLHFEKYESLSEKEKASFAYAELETVMDEIKREVRAKVTKIIGQLNEALSKKTAILDDKSKTPKQKLEALWALRKENPEVYDVLGVIFEESVPRLGLWRRRW
ncbi:unnamed protein product [Cylicocyclus nassatus]|uniref:SXP/RAL-2 family protein Ani s 5-like cation-binding domain-containing protein n=1 Tax=Cylicocyclus nassatus TaxID=53992 RepID=A0AA36DT16_CYLNA|nr:unnamed protein product [Cylicocyclus nassatus]